MRRRLKALRAGIGGVVVGALVFALCPGGSLSAAPGAATPAGSRASAAAQPSSPPQASASAAPAAKTSTRAATAGGACGNGTVNPHSGPAVRKAASPLPPPTPEKLRTLAMLEDEAKQYESGAKDFRRSLTMIVRHHYEQRRRETLSAIDGEMAVEKKALTDARDEAIRRFETFIARYSGADADPSATPDAMFRLAALYEERARSASDAEVATGLEPAIALYRRLIVEYPKYEELAAVHYYLGHALNDSGRIDEAQQAWRALACSNHFSVKPDPKDSAKILVEPMTQDHDEKYWSEWINRHPVPFDQPSAGKVSKAPTKHTVGVTADETSYQDPYAACEPIAQKIEAGQEPRYLAEVWWQIGNYHFDQIDPHGGAYNLNRSVSAYEHSLVYKKPPLYGVSMYKLAWAYYKQQRYKTGVEWFVNLLHYADEQEAKTGDPGADFRTEAYTYIAGSLTYVDFDGPPPEAPYIPRNDVLDTELDPIKAEQKMAVAIDRVQDVTLVPQDTKWSVEIYKALAQEFIEITQNRNAIATLELTLKKFPMDRDAPVMQNKVAELYDQLSHLSPEGSAARAENANKALAARTSLAAYVGTTPWTDANRDDPEALQQAEQLVRGGLKRAAADHTNYARGYYQKALELNDAGEQRALLQKAVEEYRLAETGWNAYIEQDPTSQDNYESRFWLADARYWVVVLQVAVGQSPAPTEVDAARQAAVAVRDSNEDDKYMQPAAYYVVSIADKVVSAEYKKFEDSKGSEGIEKREEVRFNGQGPDRTPIKDDVPAAVLATVCAREEYNARVALDQDPQKNGMLFAFEAGDTYFVYGQFDRARERFRPMYEQYCGQNEWGYKAWEKLISMSNFEHNTAESGKLAEGKSCAFDEETRVAEDAIRKPVKIGIAYLDASKLFEEAQKMPDGPERDKKWRAAAAAYKVALDAAPDRDEAPEAAMNGAYAYKQVGEYDKAIEMYELFISRYGNEDTLKKVRDGDPKATPPKVGDKKKFEDRVKFLKGAYDALAGSYVLFFNYPRAADTFEKISQNENFETADRREAARQALSLYSSLGDPGGMKRARERFQSLGASPKEMAEADFIIASAELKKWDPLSPPDGANGNARRSASAAMETYYNDNKTKDAAAQYVVQAGYWVAKAHKAVKSGDTDGWWKSTIAAFEKWKRLAPSEGGKSKALNSLESGMAAEAEYTMLDDQIVASYDYETGHHRYKGTMLSVVDAYKKDAVDAKKWYDKLQHVTDAYVSPEWTVATVARQGSLYDSLRTGLYNTRPPALRMFDAKQEAMLKRAENSDDPDLQSTADAIRVKVEQSWRTKRDQELDAADSVMVDRYATSVTLARRYNVSQPAVTHAIRRLAFVTELIGEAKMKQYTASVKDLGYTDGMFTKIRPGLSKAPSPQPMPVPLPVAP